MTSHPHTAERTVLRRQGLVFCVLAIVALAGMPWMSGLNDQTLLIGVAIAIFLLGVPHGALDTVFVKKLYRVRHPAQWLVFVVAYLLLASQVVLLWWSMPRLFLVSFLLISAFHFSGDPDIDLSIYLRMLYGSTAIILPTMLHAPQVAALFANLVEPQAAAEIVALLKLISTPLLIADSLLIAVVVFSDWLAGAEILFVLLLSIFAPPLVAFTVFFCGMHSPRHFLRTASLAGMAPKALLIRAALIPTLACIAAGGVAMIVLSDQSIEVRLMRIIFVGLAALTVPHMLLVEQVRFGVLQRKSILPATRQ